METELPSQRRPKGTKMWRFIFVSSLILSGVILRSQALGADTLQWDQLPPLPDREGFAGMFAGVSGNALLAAGGTNFPGDPYWKGGKKIWYDRIYVFDSAERVWRITEEKLTRPLAYGVSVTWKDSVICVGGGDRDRYYSDVFEMKLSEGRIRIESLPPLPTSCASACGGILGSRLYVAGGTDSPVATRSLKNFWSLDLAAPKGKRRWEQLEPWPGPERSDAVAAVQGGAFFIFSGVQWKADSANRPQRIAPFLTDAYRYTPGKGNGGSWQRIADVPRAVAAAPSPAMDLGKSHIVITGGIDHVRGDAEPSTHTGFDLEVFVYNSIADSWATLERMPVGASRVNAPTTTWNGQYAIVAGERAPGRRSPNVYVVSPVASTEKAPAR